MPDVLTGMRVFTTVVDAGSFAAAADKLDLSRGMTSRYLAQIEKHLGVRLLNRTTRRLSLTEAGEDYYQRAAQVLGLVEEAEQQAARGAAEPRGTLRINAPVAFGIRHLGPALGDYLARCPQLKADLTLNDRFVDLVEEGFDVAVRIARRIDPGLVARPIARARAFACAAPEYLKKHGAPKSPADLERHNCLTYAYGGPQNAWQFARKGREVSVRVKGSLHGNNGDALCSAAAAGLGIVLQPAFLVHEHVRAGTLVRVLPGWEAESGTVYAVYPSRQFLAPKVRSFVDFLVERFGGKPEWEAGIG
jgi:DNA-binding transcriptional LysR family regulator